MPVVSNVVYHDNARSRINATISDVVGPDGGLIDLDLEDVDINMDTPYPALIRAWIAAGGVPATPQAQTISDRQFFQQLAIVGVISQDEALASNAAVIPAPLLALIDAMPADQQFAAKMLVSGATVFERTHPMTIAIGAAYGWTPSQIVDFFQAAAVL